MTQGGRRNHAEIMCDRGDSFRRRWARWNLFFRALRELISAFSEEEIFGGTAPVLKHWSSLAAPFHSCGNSLSSASSEPVRLGERQRATLPSAEATAYWKWNALCGLLDPLIMASAMCGCRWQIMCNEPHHGWRSADFAAVSALVLGLRQTRRSPPPPHTESRRRSAHDCFRLRFMFDTDTCSGASCASHKRNFHNTAAE